MELSWTALSFILAWLVVGVALWWLLSRLFTLRHRRAGTLGQRGGRHHDS